VAEDRLDAERAVRVLQEHVKELAQRFEGRSMEERALFLVTEVGEVVAELLRVVGAKPPAVENGNECVVNQVKERLGIEMYDVLWNLRDPANLAGVDLGAVLKTKSEINRTRRWRG
jgi:NTP pyrophosphatase (non-canonical NTP hydrolase)